MDQLEVAAKMSEKAWSVRESKDREGTLRRRQLLVAARKVFERQGYGSTTVSDIAKEAGVSRPTFYVYFASKQDIFAILAGEVREVLRSAQDLTGVDPDDVDAVIAGTVASTFQVSIDYLEFLMILDHQSLSDPEIRRLREGIRHRGFQRTARYLETQAAKGHVTLAAPAEALAIMGTGMNELFASRVVVGEMNKEEAMIQMLKIWAVVIGRPAADPVGVIS